MPSSNDRKISQLPLLTELKEDTTFLVVSDVGTTPKNERMLAQTLFDQIPSALSIGQELNGKDVTFNTTLDATNRFYFDSLTGNLSLGSDLFVANSVHIDEDLYCSGNVHFDSFTPNFANLEIDGDFLCGGVLGVGNTLTVLGDTYLQQDVFIQNDLHLYNHLYVTELASIDKIKNNYFESLHVNTAMLETPSVFSNAIQTNSVKTKTIDVETSFTSNGYISIVGNLNADIANLKGFNVAYDATITGRLNAGAAAITGTLTSSDISSQTLYSASVSTANLVSNEVHSPFAQITDLITANVISSYTQSTDVVTDHLEANTVEIAHFNTENYTANNLAANTMTTKVTAAEMMQLKIYTTRPDPTNLPDGTSILYYHSGTQQLSFEVLMPDSANVRQWYQVFPGNQVPA